MGGGKRARREGDGGGEKEMEGEEPSQMHHSYVCVGVQTHLMYFLY